MRTLATQLIRHLTDSRTDGELLAAFLAAGGEADFGELVRRHGPLIWGVCRRALPVQADAEDAFQAVFVVLLRKARSLTASATVGPWLYRVATWTARSIRRRNARHAAKHAPLLDQFPATSPDADLPLDLDAALLSLPEKYRSPVVLCHLLGYSRADAAQKLGCPEGTLSAWLSRGLAKLRTKLRGLDPAKVLGGAAVAVPAALSTAAVRAGVASHVAVATSVAVSSTISQLAEGVLHMFWVKKATAASFALFTVFAMGVGIGLSGSTPVLVASADGQVRAEASISPLEPESDPAGKIRQLEKQIAEAKKILDGFQVDMDATAKKIAFLKAKGAGPQEIAREQADFDTLERRADDVVQSLVRLEAHLAEVRAVQLRADPFQAKKVRYLERYLEVELAAAQEVHKLMLEGVALTAKKIDLYKSRGKVDPKAEQEDLERLTKFKKEADEAAARVKKLTDELAALKAQRLAPPDPVQVKKIRDLKDQIELARLASVAADREAELRLQELLVLQNGKGPPARIEEAQMLRADAVKKATAAGSRLNKLEDELATLNQPAKPEVILQSVPNILKDIDRQLTDLKTQYELLQLERKQLLDQVQLADAKALEIERRTKAVADAAKSLEAKRAEIAKSVVAANPGGYLELRVYGKEGWFEFSVKEVGADGKAVGTAIIREPEMLAKFLARTKTDATAPKELRVVVEPTGSLTANPQAALKACDAAGYTTVKFTGYVFDGGKPTLLKPDQKGDVPGYKRHDNTERSPTQLIAEIVEGMKRG